MFWTTNDEDLTKKVNGGSYINKSGVYIGKIVESSIIDSKSSKAQGMAIVFESEEGKGRMTFWYRTKDGAENEYARAFLNRMLFLTKTKASDLKVEIKDNKKFVPALVGKEIGAIIEAKLSKDQENTEYNLKDWFEVKSRKTADEIKNNDTSAEISFWTEKFKNSQLVVIKKKEKTEEEKGTEEKSFNDDEFPFN